MRPQTTASTVAPFWVVTVCTQPFARYRGGHTLAWLKVKQPHYRTGERGWQPIRKS